MMQRLLFAACITMAAVSGADAGGGSARTDAGGGSAGPSGAVSPEDWQLCMKTNTFVLLKKDFCESIDQTAAWGMKAVEVYPAQKIGGGLEGTLDFKMDAATREKVLAKLNQAGVAMVGYGVARPKTLEECDQLFEFARAMGVRYIVMEPEAELLDRLEKLADQTGIEVAIHNHPPHSELSLYWHPERVLNAVAGRSKRLGACADTGHWVRSGLDPVECLAKLEGRIIMLHFKDLDARSEKARDTAWGQGACDAAAMLAELRRQGFKGWFAIEYENAADAMENVPRCVDFFNRCRGLGEAELRALAAAP